MLAVGILAGSGLLITVFGVAVARGRTDVLAEYPTSGGPERLASRAGGALVAHGVVTLAVAAALARDMGGEIGWIASIAMTTVVAFGIAALSIVYQ